MDDVCSRTRERSKRWLRGDLIPAGLPGIAVTIILLGSLLGLGGCSGEAVNDEGASREEAQVRENQGSGQPPQPREASGSGSGTEAEQAEVFSIGEEVSVGEVSYTVTGAERVTQLEDPYGLDETLTGNFMLLSFTFANNSSEPVTVSDIGMYLYDEQGNQYETDSDAAFYLPDDKSMFMLDRVNPGLTQEVQTIYEIPPEAGGFELEVTSGLFASETARIDLESTTETRSPGSGDPEEMEDEAWEAVQDYYEAVNEDDWAYTYAHRDSRTHSAFTEEEWAKRNQWFESTNSTTSVPVSVDLDESTLSSEQPVAEVERELIIDSTGYSEIRDASFVYEDGLWVAQYPEGGMPLYMPGATFEEFVQANSG